MKKILFIVFSLVTLNLFSQIAVGSWRTHFAYSSVTQVAETSEKVYGVSDGSLFSYDKTDQSVDSYSKLTGLSDTKISLITYSQENKVLVVVYDNSNIDILTDEGDIINIPEIYNKNLTTNKSVYEVSFSGSNAYLSCGFGISVLNLRKYEVADSYVFNKKVSSTTLYNGKIFVARADGVYQASLNSNLSDLGNWSLYNSIEASRLVVFQGGVIALNLSGGLYKLSGTELQQFYAGSGLSGMLVSKNTLLAFGYSQILSFTGLTAYTTLAIDNPSLFGISTLDPDQKIWFAFGSLGMKNSENYQENTVGIVPDGPFANSPYRIRFSGNKLLVVGGGCWDDRFNTPGYLMSFEDEKWDYIKVDTINVEGSARDFVDVIEDPNEKGHLFVASWGEGLYEFRNKKLVKIHNNQNSGLEIIAGTNSHYHRINALCYDSKGNLFMSNNYITNGLKVLTRDGQWLSLAYSALGLRPSVNAMMLYKRSKDSKDSLFVALNVRYTSGVFVFDPKDLSSNNDDKSKYYTQFDYYDNSVLKSIKPSNFYSVAQDKNGAIWVGTSEGPIVLSSPTKLFNDDFTCTRIKVPRNDGTDLADYLLDGVRVRVITVDGSNRKWLGTESSGVYLVSDNGLETIHHFTTENSPLPSDNILSIDIHPTTGEVFIGTNKGLVSYRSDAIEGKKTYSDVYAFPNPVRPEYEGLITITGLKYNSTVRITDINGNSVFEGISEGGQIVWNGRNRSGERVATGVYLVYAATSDGLDGVVTKILVVR